MKIGIVTQPLIINYGGILQNYALQQVLKKMGYDPITLDFQWGYTGVRWFLRQGVKLIAKLLGKSGDWKEKYAPLRSDKKKNQFIEKNIILSHTFWNCYDSGLIDKYNLDVIIVGSDQVWRPKYNQKLKDSFLVFAKNTVIKKIAYAASFGTEKMEYSGRQKKMAKYALKQFDAISVREKSGIENIRLLGYTATQVLDPTLLLGKKGFEDILISPKVDDYIGYYILDGENVIERDIVRIKKMIGTKNIVGITENTSDCGPSEWLGIISNSKIFITDSFHGTIFCILFHVPFFTIINRQRGADRFNSLLTPLNLEDRMINSMSEIKTIETNINWEKVDEKLRILREDSERFLVESLK